MKGQTADRSCSVNFQLHSDPLPSQFVDVPVPQNHLTVRVFHLLKDIMDLSLQIHQQVNLFIDQLLQFHKLIHAAGKEISLQLQIFLYFFKSSALFTKSALTEIAPFTYGFSFSAVLPMPLPPDVANA